MPFASNRNSLIMMVLLSIIVFTAQAQPDDEVEAKSHLEGVVVDNTTQAMVGLKTLVIHAGYYANEFTTAGKVLNIEPLLGLRSRFLIAQAELNASKARLMQTETNLKRQQQLFRDGVTAKRSLQELSAQQAAEQASVEANQIKLLALVNEAKLNWGKVLTGAMLTEKKNKYTELLLGQCELLQINLPVDRSLPVSLRRIFVDAAGQRSSAKNAEFIDTVPQVDAGFQGISYFFLSESHSGLQTGMKLTAWIADEGNGQGGMMIPESALVWYLDQLSVYLKTGQDKFQRQSIRNYTRTSQGYLIRESLHEGDEIVLVGGQMLLSEELKQHIPDED